MIVRIALFCSVSELLLNCRIISPLVAVVVVAKDSVVASAINRMVCIKLIPWLHAKEFAHGQHAMNRANTCERKPYSGNRIVL